MKCTLKTAIDCIHYRDYDGSCERSDEVCCLVMGNNSLRNLMEATVNDTLEKQVLKIAGLELELAKLRALCLRVACLATTLPLGIRESLAAAGRGERVE